MLGEAKPSEQPECTYKYMRIASEVLTTHSAFGVPKRGLTKNDARRGKTKRAAGMYIQVHEDCE
ncbi:MAG: hypothetical protein Tsb005_17380 [Gammaproteobacteria bacterium]